MTATRSASSAASQSRSPRRAPAEQIMGPRPVPGASAVCMEGSWGAATDVTFMTYETALLVAVGSRSACALGCPVTRRVVKVGC